MTGRARELSGCGPDAMVRFLRDRLTDESAAARAALRGPWVAVSTSRSVVSTNSSTNEGMPTPVVQTSVRGGTYRDLVHIALHDPYKVLRRVSAAREVLEQFDDQARRRQEDLEAGRRDEAQQWQYARLLIVVGTLASGYDWHPDFEEAWRP